MKDGVSGEKVNIAVFVSGGGTNLQALLDAEKDGIIHSGRIVLVVSDNPSAYALQRAKNAGKDTAIAEKSGRSQVEFEADLTAVLKKYNIGLIVLAGFLRILSPSFIKNYENRIINVHPSLIPSFCGKGYYGLRVHEAALAYGVKVTGATVHFVNEIPDGGKIIMQKAVEIQPDDTPETLQQRVMREAEWKILPLSAEKVCENMLARGSAANE